MSTESREQDRAGIGSPEPSGVGPGTDGTRSPGTRPEASTENDRLRSEAAHALRQGRFGPAERLVSEGRSSVEALVHDLRVHQVELEMQADELRAVNDRLEGALAQFRELFELLPHAAFVTDRSGGIIEANDLARRSLDALADRRTPDPALRHIGCDPEARARLSGLYGELGRHGIVRLERCQVLGPAGDTRIVDVHARRLGGVPKDRFLVLLLDRTEQERATRSHASLFENAIDAIVILGADTRIRRMNRAAERLLLRAGDPRLRATPFEAHLDEGSRSLFRRAVLPLQGPMMEAQRRTPLELRVLGAGAEPVPVEATLSWADPGTGEIVLILRDVSAREETIAAYRESEHRFRQVTESMTEVFWLRDPDVGRWLHVSPAFETLFGLRAADLMVNPELWVRAVHPEDRHRVRRHHSGAGTEAEIEYRVVRPDGEVRWVRDRRTRVRSTEPGEHRLAGTVADVTGSREDRRRIELLESAVGELDEIVMVVELPREPDGEFRIVFANDALERITGWSADEAIGRPLPLLRGPATDPEDSARVDAALRGCRPVTLELQVHRKSGEPFWTEIDASPVLDGGGHAMHMVAILRDVTERRREAERRQRTQRLEAVGLLTGGIAHDFNNLLTVIKGQAELLGLARGADDSAVAPIIEAASRGADLTRRLLAFAGRQPLAPRPVVLDDTVRHTLRLLERTLGPQVEIHCDLAGAGGRVMVDVGAFENAMVNLCLNARDAMRPEGGRLSVRTGPVPADPGDGAGVPQLGIEIEDDGHGIAPEVLPRIFDPFFTTKAAGNGTGLGLAMVHTFLQQSGGSIEVRSEPGLGACFRIRLPALRAAQADAPVSERNPVPAGADRLVLVVEDDPGVRAFVVACLGSLGYRTLACERFEEALAHRRRHPELACILSDVMLRGARTGRELAEACRAEQPELPVVLMTGYDPEVAPSEHADAVLHKPFDRDALGRTLGRVLAGDRGPGAPAP